MTPEEIDGLIQALTVFTLAILVGIAVISKVPATLHTPLMSGANSTDRMLQMFRKKPVAPKAAADQAEA